MDPVMLSLYKMSDGQCFLVWLEQARLPVVIIYYMALNFEFATV